jgi:serine/threonine protein kinase
VRLTDLIVNSQSVIRSITTFVRYPGDLLFREARKIVERKVEDIEIPIPKQAQKTLSSIAPENRSISSSSTPSRSTVALSDTSSAKETSNRSTKDLNSGRDLVGRRGRYKISSSLTTVQGGKHWRKTLYQGRSSNNNPVIIEEYLFPKLNTKEMEALKRQIDRLETINLRSGGVQDFRIIVPWDFLVDTESKSGYLISQQNPPNRTTLQIHVDQHGPMSSPQVKLFLAQALQTLRFLHQQTVRFADSSTQQGLIHGNLSLDTILIENGLQTVGGLPQFRIYLKELSLWRQHFEQPKLTSKTITSLDCQKDLRDLGKVAASLLMGEAISGDDSKLFNPKKYLPWEDTWSSHPDESCKEFILQLLGIKHSLTTAEEASRELRQLKEEALAIPETESIPEPDSSEPWGCSLWFWLAIAALPLGLWLYFKRPSPSTPIAPISQSGSTARNFTESINNENVQAELNKLTAPEYRYMVSPLLSDLIGLKRVSSNQNLQMALAERDRSKKIASIKLTAYSGSSWQAKLKSGEAAFILQEKDEKIPSDFEQKVIAYDGITIFVGSTDPQKKASHEGKEIIPLPKQLEGNITIEEIKAIFTGTNNIRNLDFDRYVPKDQQVVYMFKKLVFGSESNEIKGTGSSPPKSSNELIATIFQNAQNYHPNDKIAIGFDRISKVMGQCSVYPLSIGSSNSVQPVIQDSGIALNPETNLCHSKGSYWANEAVFEHTKDKAASYPLAYALAIVYLKQDVQSSQKIPKIDQNIKAAEAFYQVLTTDEGQCLLSEAGLVSVNKVRQRRVCNGGG